MLLGSIGKPNGILDIFGGTSDGDNPRRSGFGNILSLLLGSIGKPSDGNLDISGSTSDEDKPKKGGIRNISSLLKKIRAKPGRHIGNIIATILGIMKKPSSNISGDVAYGGGLGTILRILIRLAFDLVTGRTPDIMGDVMVKMLPALSQIIDDPMGKAFTIFRIFQAYKDMSGIRGNFKIGAKSDETDKVPRGKHAIAFDLEYDTDPIDQKDVIDLHFSIPFKKIVKFIPRFLRGDKVASETRFYIDLKLFPIRNGESLAEIE
ncbi:hypothetical protein JTB14_037209 [Gonioctena quinquepunctata]|nr:hypothetical protein JTB14_037209 [Gonioctena quinquepunctata]